MSKGTNQTKLCIEFTAVFYLKRYWGLLLAITVTGTSAILFTGSSWGGGGGGGGGMTFDNVTSPVVTIGYGCAYFRCPDVER